MLVAVGIYILGEAVICKCVYLFKSINTDYSGVLLSTTEDRRHLVTGEMGRGGSLLLILPVFFYYLGRSVVTNNTSAKYLFGVYVNKRWLFVRVRMREGD